MTAGRAHLENHNNLDTLRHAFTDWGDHLRQRMNAAEAELEETRDWVAQRVNYWSHEVSRLQAAVAGLESELALCMAGPEPSGCHYLEEEIAGARESLSLAFRSVECVENWRERIEKAAARWRVDRDRASQELSTTVPEAARFLDQAARAVEGYDQRRPTRTAPYIAERGTLDVPPRQRPRPSVVPPWLAEAAAAGTHDVHACDGEEEN